jgi:hypothetical protein
MNILITKQMKAEKFSIIEMTNGKQSMTCAKGDSGQITVCCHNASNRAWGGLGRSFRSFEDAEAAYKSQFMRSAIALAKESL